MELNSNSDWFKELIKQSFNLFKKLTAPTIAICITLLILMMLCFLSIYFFGNNIFHKHSIVISLLLSICMAFVWCLFNVFLMPLASMFFSKAFDLKNTKDKSEELILVGSLNSIIYLSLIMFISYLFNLSLRHVLIMSASYPIVASLIVGSVYLLISRMKK
jgi:hypothetical protein